MMVNNIGATAIKKQTHWAQTNLAGSDQRQAATVTLLRTVQYAPEHGPTKVAHHFLSLLKHPVLESMARFFKKQSD